LRAPLVRGVLVLQAQSIMASYGVGIASAINYGWLQPIKMLLEK